MVGFRSGRLNLPPLEGSGRTTRAEQHPLKSALPSSGGKSLRLAIAVATSFGLGCLPVAPGTWGSAAGLVLVACTAVGVQTKPRFVALFAEVGLLIVVAAMGVWSSGCLVAAAPENPDPPYVAIDEISGQVIALIGSALLDAAIASHHGGLRANFILGVPLSWKYLIVGFLLFRLFDIWKPFPIRRAEFLRGGFGIMADDWIAGVYAAFVLWLVHALRV